MARTWISAGLGWKMVSTICKTDIETYEFLIGAAETGALSARAERIIFPDREEREAPLPQDFWNTALTRQISYTSDFREFTSTTKDGVASRAIDTFFDFF